jgi:hypothetical protein
MKNHSEQEIFNRVITHLAGQERQSVGLDGECRYRSPEGMSCAVGCLISDDDYEVEMEGADVVYLIKRFEAVSWMAPFRDLLDELQDLHDMDKSWNGQGLTSIALKHIQLIADSHGLTNPLS